MMQYPQELYYLQDRPVSTVRLTIDIGIRDVLLHTPVLSKSSGMIR